MIEVRFAADRMLGRLAKWLRILGQDVLYGRHLTGYGLIRAARAEERLILTRNRRLRHMHPPPYLLIESDRYRDQLRQVVDACGLRVGAAVLSRCIVCNALLESETRQSVGGLVPPYVRATQEGFSRCPSCRRIYWPATHHLRMLEELKKMGVA